MNYRLLFKEEALKEWHKLDSTLRAQFKKKLAERVHDPRVPSAKLAGHADRYKIKLKSSGYRLVYEVRNAEIVVLVVAIGKRERNAIYAAAARR
jgi:mRNA interferase RelE/StbE